MKTKIIISLFIVIVLSACSAQKIVLDEMVITDPEQFSSLKNEQITISTKDSINYFAINPNTEKSFVRKRIITDRQVNNYNFKLDSLYVNDPLFQTVIGLRTISCVKFKGIYDNELGFVSETELNKYSSTTKNLTGSLIGGIIGCAAGAFIGSRIHSKSGGSNSGSSKSSGFWSSNFSFGPDNETIFGGILGIVAGLIIGWELAPQQTIQEILNDIKKQR